MKSKFNLPGFTAETNFIKVAKSIKQPNLKYRASNRELIRQGAIVPAATCDNVNCDAALATCILLFNPVSCGLYSNCCLGGPSFQRVGGDPDCRNEPCAPGCPPDLCIASMDHPLSVEDSASQDPTLHDIKKQLNRIERCACGTNKLVYNSPPFSLRNIPYQDIYAFPPQSPIPPSPYYMNSY